MTIGSNLSGSGSSLKFYGSPTSQIDVNGALVGLTDLSPPT